MQVKQYLKGIAIAAVAPLYKALASSYPNYATGMALALGSPFSWSLSGMAAYNNKIFYSGLNILVRKMVEAPLLFNKKKGTGKVKFDKFYSKNITNEKRFVLKALALTELEDHPLIDLFNNPNSYQVGIEMMEDFWYNYGFGDGFLWFEVLETGRNAGKPVKIHSLNRSRVEVIQSTDDNDRVSHYVYTAWSGKQIPIQKENILHLKHWNPNLGELKGYGVDVAASMDIALNDANNAMQGASFKNGGRGTIMSSDITVDAQGETTEKMTAEQMEVLKDSVKKDWEGVKNYNRVHFTNGFLSVQQYGDTLVESEAIKAEDSQWKNIFTIIGIPWVLSPAASSVSENSVIVGYKSLVTNLVVSELRKFDQKLSQKIQQWYSDVIPCHDLTEFAELAPDLKLMKEVYGSPLLHEDERRAIFGYDKLDGGQGKVILVPSGFMKLEDVISDDFSGVPDPGDEEINQL